MMMVEARPLAGDRLGRFDPGAQGHAGGEPKGGRILHRDPAANAAAELQCVAESAGRRPGDRRQRPVEVVAQSNRRSTVPDPSSNP